MRLTASEAKATGFTHKLKMKGAKSEDLRIYGNANGHIFFEKAMGHKKNK